MLVLLSLDSGERFLLGVSGEKEPFIHSHYGVEWLPLKPLKLRRRQWRKK
jgi:hypothetical protein